MHGIKRISSFTSRYRLEDRKCEGWTEKYDEGVTGWVKLLRFYKPSRLGLNLSPSLSFSFPLRNILVSDEWKSDISVVLWGHFERSLPGWPWHHLQGRRAHLNGLMPKSSVTRSQPTWTPMGDFWSDARQWGNIFWKNSVHRSSRAPETWWTDAKVEECWGCSSGSWWPNILLNTQYVGF